MEEEQIQQEPLATISAKEFAAKANSKREIYQLLSQEACAYLPQPTLISIYFLKDLISGFRKFVKNQNVKHYHVPYYDTLSISVMFAWASTSYPNVGVFFPIQKEQAKLPRQWIINVLYSVIGEPFAKFIICKTEERNQMICIKKDLSVAIDPDVLAAFNKSTLVSVGKSATGASLLKVGSKRKRTKREMEEEKANKSAREQEIQEKLQSFGQMEEQMQQMQSQAEQNLGNTQLINNLVSQGIARFEENGDLTIIES